MTAIRSRLLTTCAGLLPDFKPWTPEQSANVAFHMAYLDSVERTKRSGYVGYSMADKINNEAGRG